MADKLIRVNEKSASWPVPWHLYTSRQVTALSQPSMVNTMRFHSWGIVTAQEIALKRRLTMR